MFTTIPRHLLWLGLLLSSALAFAHDNAAPPSLRCRALLQGFAPALGTPVAGFPGMANFSGAYDIRRLGEGQGGGTVYRLTPTDGHASFVIKVYRQSSRLGSDVRALALLKELGSGLPVKVPGFTRMGADWLRLADIHGRTLEDVVKQRLLPDAELEKLSELYYFYVRSVATLLKAAHPEMHVMTGRGYLSAVRDEAPTIQILIKQDNIIVDAVTHQLYLIDPY